MSGREDENDRSRRSSGGTALTFTQPASVRETDFSRGCRRRREMGVGYASPALFRCALACHSLFQVLLELSFARFVAYALRVAHVTLSSAFGLLAQRAGGGCLTPASLGFF